jgi:hypothetical protein
MIQQIPVVKDVTPAADGTYTYDLPVHPVSHLILTIKALNVTNEATLAEILAMVSKVQVSYLGQSIVDISAADLFALSSYVYGHEPFLENRVADDNGTRYISLIVPFSRRLYDPSEGFPATKRGEFQVNLTVDIANSGADGLIIQLDACCMLGASPAAYLKSTTLTKTPAATGENDVDLPIGHKVKGLLVYSTTVPATTAWTTSADMLTVLLNDLETGYIGNYWETLHGQLLQRASYDGGHAAAAGDSALVHYAMLDFDPADKNDHLLETSGASNFKLRITAGDTNAIRIIPMQLVEGLPAAAA